jgi:prepilin-type processing-associated H-X9-DG protein
MTFPTGWGGEATDSIAQQWNAGMDDRDGQWEGAHKTFVQTITPGQENFYDAKLVSFQDVAHVPVIADGGLSASWLSIATMAYPDICCAECSGVAALAWCGSTEGHDGSNCDAECYSMHATQAWAEDPNMKRATARHLGGSNVGWADGHASWISAQTLCAMSDEGDVEGVGWICTGSPGSGSGGTNPVTYARECGDIPPGMVFLHNEPIDWYGNLYRY